MSDFPDHNVVDVLRDIIQLCENHKIGEIHVGPIRLRFDKSQTPPILGKDEIEELRRSEEMDIKYAHVGYVPYFPDHRGGK
jgi:hypothetical protein